MAMKKSICRTLTHIDVAARSSVQLQAPITKTFSTTTGIITIRVNRFPTRGRIGCWQCENSCVLATTILIRILRTSYAFLTRDGLAFGCGFVSVGISRGDWLNGGADFRHYLPLGVAVLHLRSRSILPGDSTPKDRPEKTLRNRGS